MEKIVRHRSGGVRRVIKAGEAAEKKNLKIAAGLMCRHSPNRQELIQRIRDGAMGQIQLIRAYRMEPGGVLPPRSRPTRTSCLADPQLHPRSSGSRRAVFGRDGHPPDRRDAAGSRTPSRSPRTASAAGRPTAPIAARTSTATRSNTPSPTAPRRYDVGRYIPNCYNEFATFVHGTKCAAQFSGNIHAATVHIYKDQRTRRRQHRLEAGQGEAVTSLAGRVERAAWTPSATTGRTTRPSGRPARTWPTSWAGRPSTRARSSPGTRRWPRTSSSARTSTR